MERRKSMIFLRRSAIFLESRGPYSIPDDGSREKPVPTKNVNGISPSPVNLFSSYSPVRKNEQGYVALRSTNTFHSTVRD